MLGMKHMKGTHPICCTLALTLFKQVFNFNVSDDECWRNRDTDDLRTKININIFVWNFKFSEIKIFF